MWILYALLTILSYASFDFFIKKTAGKINDYIGIISILLVAIIPSVIMLIIVRFPKKVLVTQDGLMHAGLAGLALGIGTIAFLKLFDSGVELSLASPLVRIGIMITTTALGLFILREVIEPREWLGVGLALLGVIILVWK